MEDLKKELELYVKSLDADVEIKQRSIFSLDDAVSAPILKKVSDDLKQILSGGIKHE